MGIGIWHKFALTGGTATSLDGIAIASLTNNDVCHVHAGGTYYYYVFDATATDAESSPTVIRPDDYSTAGVWKLGASPYGNLQVQPSIVSGLAIEGGITGGNVTVSGNTLTITPTTCLDSGLTTQLYTSANQTVVIPSVANTNYFVFLVKLAVGGTFEFRAYTTLAGVASDGDVSKYRFITWAQTNGSSVVRPFIQTAGRYSFTTSSRPIIAASLTTSFVSKTISTIIPTASGIFSRLKLLAVGSGSGLLAISHDGTTPSDGCFFASGIPGAVDMPSAASVYAKYLTVNCSLEVSGVEIRR